MKKTRWWEKTDRRDPRTAEEAAELQEEIERVKRFVDLHWFRSAHFLATEYATGHFKFAGCETIEEFAHESFGMGERTCQGYLWHMALLCKYEREQVMGDRFQLGPRLEVMDLLQTAETAGRLSRETYDRFRSLIWSRPKDEDSQLEAVCMALGVQEMPEASV